MGPPSDADPSLTVLHLEDSSRDAELVRERLADAGRPVRVDWAANEREFESFLRHGEYDVILADYELPGFDAPAALRLAGALRPGTPFICVSGAIGEDSAVELLKQGATDYVRKDRLERLALKVRRAVDEAEGRRARQEAEVALRESETRYRRLHESMRDAFVLVDMSGRILETNRAYQEMLGYDAEELSRLTYPEITPERWQAFEARIVTEEILPRGHSEVYQKEYVRKDGTVFPVELRTFLLRNDAGEPTGMWAIVRDVTERKRAEAALRVEGAALNAAANAVVITDREGHVEWINPAFEALTGFSAEEALGKNPRELVNSGRHDRAFFAGLWNTILAGNVWRGEITNRRKDGSLYLEEMTITPVRDESGEISHFVAVKSDISERRRLERQLRAAQRLDAIGRLAGGVAHDFNNALAVILGYAERGLGRLAPLDPLHHDLREIVRTVERSASLTRQLLGFARRQIAMPRVLGLNEAVASLAKMLPRLIGEDVELRIVAGEGLWNVKIDPAQVDQILVNLVTNARDAIPDVGVITVETSNVVLDDEACRTRPGLRPGEYVRLAVGDTGVGMDETTRGQVFEPFFTTKPEGKGTGLGLATVYGIVKQNTGFIDVHSEPGHGTTFEVYLRRSSEEAERPAEKGDERSLTGTETVLLVEDEPALLQIVRDSLESLGYTVLAASSPGEAVLLCQMHPGEIHVLLTDVVMPTMNGNELQGLLERIKPGLRTVMMSGYPANATTQPKIVGQGQLFIQKPFTREALASKIREALQG
ncbi:MAG TPA: PAS domain S-box protein [Vicinamibacteria bacterium]|nr:PAS domain S-box protein [Vicinamibacteria bacterium]